MAAKWQAEDEARAEEEELHHAHEAEEGDRPEGDRPEGDRPEGEAEEGEEGEAPPPRGFSDAELDAAATRIQVRGQSGMCAIYLVHTCCILVITQEKTKGFV